MAIAQEGDLLFEQASQGQLHGVFGAVVGGDVEAEGWARLARGFHWMSFATPAEAVPELGAAMACFEAVDERGGHGLAVAGLADTRIALWVRPNHCLFDGIDLDAWLGEGLCDEVIADRYSDATVCESTPEWQRSVQEKGAELIRGLPYGNAEEARRVAEEAIAAGYDGLCTYESDFAVLDADYIALYESLRR